eukprot:scaffold67204_cov30-Tisochrysis_lutea.AAC.8
MPWIESEMRLSSLMGLAEKPASSTAVTREESGASPVTVARADSSSTETVVTPLTAASARSTFPVQWAHIIPWMARVVVRGWTIVAANPAASSASSIVSAAACPSRLTRSDSRSSSSVDRWGKAPSTASSSLARP